MSVAMNVIDFRRWPNALRLSNGDAELIVTLDVGPRILSYSRTGGVNPFNIYADQAGGVGEPQWKIRGGHRLWLAPEGPAFSYYPDNRTVAWEKIGETGVRLTPPPEPTTGFQKEIDLILDAAGARATVVHRIIRTAAAPRLAAPWALSVMAPGGFAVLPQPPLGEHPRDLLPTRRLALWSYTDLSDPRWRFGRKFITLRQEPGGRPTKVGMSSAAGWAAYVLKRTVFIKRFSFVADAEYPDFGSNLEAYADSRMLELETLGPVKLMERGEKAELIEHWDLRDDLPGFDPADEDAMEAALLRALSGQAGGQ